MVWSPFDDFDAEKLIAKKIKNAPSQIENYLVLASVFSQQGEDARARHILRKALSQQPGNAEAGLALSDMYAQLDRRDDAIRVLRSVADVSSTPEIANRLSNFNESAADRSTPIPVIRAAFINTV